jgi:hypothetical protein
MSVNTIHGATVPADFVADVLGVKDPERAKMLKRLMPALIEIDPELVPAALDHVHTEDILLGVAGLGRLLTAFNDAKREDDRVLALDALCLVLEHEHATREVVEALQGIMQKTESAAVLSMAARALASARYVPFLEQQRQFLASESPSELRRSIRLLGHGRYVPALPVLLRLLRPDQMAIVDVLVWTLGEIRDPAAIAGLHTMLERFVMSEAVLDALGKIGAVVSVMRVLPVLLEGTQGQREAAARAMARIADVQGGDLGDKTLARSLREALEKVIDKDPSPKVRFYSMVAFAKLDGHLEPNRIVSVLGGSLPSAELQGAAKLLGPARGKKVGRSRPKL